MSNTDELTSKLRALTDRLESQRDKITSEAAVRITLINPFLRAMGYDTEDIEQVVPEFFADVGTKKGEAVDYAILQDGQPVILIETKPLSDHLGVETVTQLFRYFASTDARIGLLTNGESFRFFTDLEKPNTMDETPFFEFQLGAVDQHIVQELRRFTRSNFDTASAVDAAGRLKYVTGLNNVLRRWFSEPLDEEFASFLIRQVHQGPLTRGVYNRMAPLVSKALRMFLEDHIKNTLDSAMEKSRLGEPEDEPVGPTADELTAYRIVKALIADVIDPDSVHMTDNQDYKRIYTTQPYASVCWLYLRQKPLVVAFARGPGLTPRKVEISSVDDLTRYAAEVQAPVDRALAGDNPAETIDVV